MLYDLAEMAFMDELLGKNVIKDDLAIAEKWLYLFAQRLGVEQAKVIRSFVADELVTLYTYRETCVRKAYSLPGAYGRGCETDDFYGKKLAYIQGRIKELEGSITPEDLTGDPTQYSGYRSCEIFRG